MQILLQGNKRFYICANRAAAKFHFPDKENLRVPGIQLGHRLVGKAAIHQDHLFQLGEVSKGLFQLQGSFHGNTTEIHFPEGVGKALAEKGIFPGKCYLWILFHELLQQLTIRQHTGERDPLQTGHTGKYVFKRKAYGIIQSQAGGVCGTGLHLQGNGIVNDAVGILLQQGGDGIKVLAGGGIYMLKLGKPA